MDITIRLNYFSKPAIFRGETEYIPRIGEQIILWIEDIHERCYYKVINVVYELGTTTSVTVIVDECNQQNTIK